MKSNKGFNLPSGVCVPYTFLLFMTKGGVGGGGGAGGGCSHPPGGSGPSSKTSFSLSWLQAEAESQVLTLKSPALEEFSSFLFF